MLDFEEKPLDEVAFAIEGVVAVDLWRGFPRRDDRHGPQALDGISESSGIIAFIAKDIVGGKVFDQGFGLGEVAGLSRR